jgi:uncharacterized protein
MGRLVCSHVGAAFSKFPTCRYNANDMAKLAKAAAAVLKESPEVLFGYLFGSLARGDAVRKSDVDIGIFLAPGSDPAGTKQKLTIQLMEALQKERVDVVVLNSANPGLLFSILRDGIVILDRDRPRRISFEVRALRKYWDFAPYRRILDQSLRKQIERWGHGS